MSQSQITARSSAHAPRSLCLCGELELFPISDENEETMKTKIRLFDRRIRYVFAFITLPFMLSVVNGQVGFGVNQDIQKLNRFVQTAKDDTPAMKLFREGRDQIEAENWPKAGATFRDFVRSFPHSKDTDAALYWLAYALQKQGKQDEAAASLERLMRDYPASSWRREAEALLVVLGHQDVVQKALDRNNCEIKVLALQSLFQADEERAIAFVSEILKTNPTDCPSLKPAAVSLLGAHAGARAIPILIEIARSPGDLTLRLTAIKRLGDQKSDSVTDELLRLYDADRTKELRAQILRALAESHSPRATAKLVEVARGSDDLVARMYAIRFLGDINDPSSLDQLISIYDADQTPEVRMAILRSLGDRDEQKAHEKLLAIARQGDTPALRIEAIRRLGDRGKMNVDEMLQLYTSETDAAIKQGLIRAYADMKDPRARQKLYEIARSQEKPEMRLFAIRALGRRNDPDTTQQLIAMYDAETNVQVRGMLIRAFGDSHEKVAIQKLIAIARNDQSVDLRKLAVRMLGDSKDPEALKFLEELLK